MAGNAKSKLKLLYLLDYLRAETDEERGVTMADIRVHLAAYGITCERKSIYADLALLADYGLDIALVRAGTGSEYRLLSREFELAELKLLVDAAASCRFLSKGKSLRLIKKLGALASRGQAKELQRQVQVDDRKNLNESVLYALDAVHAALRERRRLRFSYFDYGIDKRPVYRHGRALYDVTPLCLHLADDNYYLEAYNPERDIVATFRVDRMSDAALSDAPFHESPLIGAFRPEGFAARRFAQFSGQRGSVTLRFPRRLASVALDRFGSAALLIPDGEDAFTVTAEVEVGPTFFGWVFGFAGEVSVVSPDAVAAAYRAALEAALRA